jgi:hypothetical protein
MAKQIINTGSVPNDNTGDNLRSGGNKINENFNEIYAAFGDGTDLLAADINLPNQKFLFSNVVANKAELDTFSPTEYAGCVVYVNAESSLYYAANGVWREVLTDTSDGVNNSYTDPLSQVAYSGNLTDLGIDDGNEGQVLTTNGNRTFNFVDITALQTTLEGQTGAFYLNFENFTNLPTTISGYGITDAFNGDYNSLSNRPSLATIATTGNFTDLQNRPTTLSGYGITDAATSAQGTLATTAVQPGDLANIATTGNFSDLSGTPTTLSGYGIVDAFDGTFSSLVGTPTTLSGYGITDAATSAQGTLAGTAVQPGDLATVATSGSYNDLGDKPTSFANLTSLEFTTGTTVNEFSTDGTLAGNSNTVVPTEFAVKTYVDNQTVSSLTDLGISDGSIGQVLTTDGNGNFTFENPGDTIGNFTLSSSTIDTDDSSAISITPSVVMESDLTVENDATVNGLLTVSRLNVTGNIESGGTGTPELFSEGAILLTASTRVEVTQTPFKMASFTTAQRDTLTPENGDTIYNTTTNKFQGYAGGSWVDLH